MKKQNETKRNKTKEDKNKKQKQTKTKNTCNPYICEGGDPFYAISLSNIFSKFVLDQFSFNHFYVLVFLKKNKTKQN